jgi:hypothetical protein
MFAAWASVSDAAARAAINKSNQLFVLREQRATW